MARKTALPCCEPLPSRFRRAAGLLHPVVDRLSPAERPDIRQAYEADELAMTDMGETRARARSGKTAPAASQPDDIVFEKIHRAIAYQQLPPGTRLREDAMSKILGVSRARIRKAFARLAHIGIVRIEPNRGASVTHPTVKEAREIFAARRAIEPTIARAAAARIGPAERSRIEAHIAQEQTAERQRDRPAMIRLSGEFHLLLAEIADNATLTEFLRGLITRDALVIAAYEVPGQPSCSNHEHELILAALLAKDIDRAVALMVEHLDHVEERLDLDRKSRQSVDLAKIFDSA
jgi:DNA-binding GntR family transcriptional regulator